MLDLGTGKFFDLDLTENWSNMSSHRVPQAINRFAATPGVIPFVVVEGDRKGIRRERSLVPNAGESPRGEPSACFFLSLAKREHYDPIRVGNIIGSAKLR